MPSRQLSINPREPLQCLETMTPAKCWSLDESAAQAQPENQAAAPFEFPLRENNHSSETRQSPDVSAHAANKRPPAKIGDALGGF
jgi:hypothetical protein